MISEHPSTNSFRKFYKAIENDVTDYGYCCHITTFLNFVNPATVKMDSASFSGKKKLTVRFKPRLKRLVA